MALQLVTNVGWNYTDQSIGITIPTTQSTIVPATGAVGDSNITVTTAATVNLGSLSASAALTYFCFVNTGTDQLDISFDNGSTYENVVPAGGTASGCCVISTGIKVKANTSSTTYSYTLAQ